MTGQGDATKFDAIVVGAGLGGLAAALQLRELGHRVSVLEQADALGEVGAGIQLAPNATAVLSALGVAERLTANAVSPQAVVWRRWGDGSVLRVDPLGGDAVDEFGSPYWQVHRADLHRALVDTATDPSHPGGPIPIELGQRVDRIEHHEGAATVHTADGSSLRAALVVGADGIHSAVRPWVTEERPATYSGDVAYRLLVRAERIAADPELAGLLDPPVTTLWVGPGRHVVHYLVRDRALLNIVALVETPEGSVESWMAATTVEELLDRFAGWDERLLRVFSLAEQVNVSGLYDRAELPTWSNGHVALLGDACHPMLPYRAQGAAQAFEDAAALGEALRGATITEIPHRLSRYEEVRKPRASEVQQASRDSQVMLHLADGDEQYERDQALVAHGDDAYERYRWLWTPAGQEVER